METERDIRSRQSASSSCDSGALNFERCTSSIKPDFKNLIQNSINNETIIADNTEINGDATSINSGSHTNSLSTSNWQSLYNQSLSTLINFGVNVQNFLPNLKSDNNSNIVNMVFFFFLKIL